MQCQPLAVDQQDQVVASLSFVESLARRVAASMPHSIDLADLVQDGVLGLIDAVHRFDKNRGIKFETFAEQRVRGAMIDALRKDAWPRGVRRIRRQLETAREELRRELGCEPSLSDLAARVDSDEERLGKTIVRIKTIESTSPRTTAENLDETNLPPVMMPSAPQTPENLCGQREAEERVRDAIASLPSRERKVISLYYYGEATMKQIGVEIGVNESRVSQLHARAIRRLQKNLKLDFSPRTLTVAIRPTLLEFKKSERAKKTNKHSENYDSKVENPSNTEQKNGVILPYSKASRATCCKSSRRNGFVSNRQPFSSRNRSVSASTMSPLTKTTRHANAGEIAAIAR